MTSELDALKRLVAHHGGVDQMSREFRYPAHVSRASLYIWIAGDRPMPRAVRNEILRQAKRLDREGK